VFWTIWWCCVGVVIEVDAVYYPILGSCLPIDHWNFATDQPTDTGEIIEKLLGF